MLHLCPRCRRRFDEAGFCPFDGTSLTPGTPADQPTVVTEAISAVAAPPDLARASPAELATARDLGPTEPELRRGTFPLTPSPGGPGGRRAPSSPAPQPPTPPAREVSTGEITTTRTRPGRAASDPPRGRAPSDSPRVDARSASDNPAEALALYRGARDSEYDRLVGQTLDGRYHIENKIGEGGMGVVFSARHAVIERPLAIKVLKRDAMRDTATIRRFVQEAQAASRIGHPNIVDVTDFGTTPDGMTYSVMEFVPGRTLGTALRHEAPFPARRAIRIAAQIARALAAAHDKGIVHRDLKPENVFLLDRDGRADFVKIVDFGIAKVTPPSGKAAEPRLTRAGSVFGTPEYMAPEQAAGRSDTDGRVDIYALGVILYEMLCGRVPHRGDSMVRTLAMQMLDPIEPPSRVRPDLQIAPELEAVVMRALAKKREARYQTMGELLEALEAVVPPAVAHSVTGSPVYALAPLPPGADPGVVASLPAIPIQSSDDGAVASRAGAGPASSVSGVGPVSSVGGPPPAAPGSVGGASASPGSGAAASIPGVGPVASVAGPTASGAASARAPGARRSRDEPEFTAGDRPSSFDHVFTSELAAPRARRWPAVLLLGLIGGGAAATVTLVVRSHRAVIGERGRDAGVLVPPPDAAIARAPADAGPDAPEVVVVPVDAGRAVRVVARRDLDAGATVPLAATPNHRGTIEVQILTQPEGANLYDDEHHYRGPGGAEVEEPLGTRRTFTCRQPGYKPGTVEVVFDLEARPVLCVLTRIKICINGIKNPFDDCEVPPAPGSGSPGAPGSGDASSGLKPPPGPPIDLHKR
ncbi:MAG TPA: protein kinase [Kofleriaceae bacterium]|nr:protein kinase [Kofleriaceae bacterium]